MNKHDIHIDLIEKYLDNNLDMEEVQLFEEILENDEAFVRDLNDMELLISGIKKSASLTTIDEKLERFENSIKITEEEDDVHDKKIIFFDFDHIKKYSWAIAASISIILVSSVALFNINQTPTHQKLYAKYYQAFENSGTKRSMGEAAETAWKKALYYYDNEQYDLALENFNKVLISDYKGSIKHPSFLLYKGNTLMKLNRHTDAIQIFEGMLSDNDGLILMAKWYLSMCYLHENNSEKYVSLLKEIADVKSSYYSEKAIEILDQIK